MKKDGFPKLSIWVSVLAVIICVITIWYSHHVDDVSRARHQEHQKSLDVLYQKIAGLEAALMEISNKAATAKQRTDGSSANVNSKKSISSNSPSVSSQHRTMHQMEQILDSTGLARLAETKDIDPDILQQMYDEYALRNQAADYRQKLLQTNRDHLDADRKNYGADLMSLYELARLRRGSGVDRETREKAFEQMLEKYPDAYATAIVIGERAVRSAFRRNTAAVEEYYDMLRSSNQYPSVTTERGMEVLPNIEHYLAQQYLRDGRMEDARAMRDSIELNFPDSYILTREPGTGRRWVPVSQVLSNLDQQLK